MLIKFITPLYSEIIYGGVVTKDRILNVDQQPREESDHAL
jgi:hypothetical protein